VKFKGLILAGLTFLTLFGSLIPSIPAHQAFVVLQGPTSEDGRVSVIVESDHDLTSSDIELLRGYGVVTTVAGPIAVIHTNTESLAQIAHLSFITRLEKSYPLSVQLDQSVPDTGAPEVWDEVKDPSGRNVTGAGVIVGFVDTGIDTTHRDFTFPNGTTKILYVWDQTTSGRPPAGFGYGYECNSDDIQARTCPEIDTFGHGTHVAGIATSSGVATGNYTGVAPGARIIFVKSGHEVCNGDSWTFDTDQILDGVNYMVEKAAHLKMRLVVSLSLGGNIGAHDGTDPFEKALDTFVKQGTPIVVAAGNEAQDQDHIDGQITQGQNITFQLGLRESTTDVAIDIWFPTQDQLSGTLHAPNGTSYAVTTSPAGITTSFGEVNATMATFPDGNEIYIEFNSTNSLPLNGWSVSLIGNQVPSEGSWNAWTDYSSCSFPGSFFLPGDHYSVDSQDTIAIPATAVNVVSVGAYVTKTSWKGSDGRTYGEQDITLGDIASFSSVGPTRDGRIKPDVVAPGEFIASARSINVPESPSDPDSYHRILAGTSMATPHVAGVIALILQYAPNLPAIEIPTILRQTARLDSFTGIIPIGSWTWGFGKVDARTATGLGRQTIVINGIPSTISVPLQVKGTGTVSVPGESWNSYYFAKGSTFNVTLDRQILATFGTRYVLRTENRIGAMNPIILANYTTQYLLLVNSPFGSAAGGGWYDANSNATITGPTSVPAPGILGYVGATYVLSYWEANDGTILSNMILMDGPKSVTAVYTLVIPELTFLEVLVASTAIVATAILFARKKLS